MLQLVIRTSIVLAAAGLAQFDTSGKGLFMVMWAGTIGYVVGHRAYESLKSMFKSTTNSRSRITGALSKPSIRHRLMVILLRTALLTGANLFVRFQLDSVSFTYGQVIISFTIVMLVLLAAEDWNFFKQEAEANPSR
ncbi:hypothetical protein SAMN06265795_106198 [Noviherbaspirillum humi]|uniref:ATP synthase I chain n=1 Tax=Noviherbaspirillum humi TaxID=1688639 RepID=A0A239HDH2_9BURK|nr:hypothetical protein SAMN06265795_106198 [Noviherbaspirillum humi]